MKAKTIKRLKGMYILAWICLVGVGLSGLSGVISYDTMVKVSTPIICFMLFLLIAERKETGQCDHGE